jgi:four helix bundle protein
MVARFEELAAYQRCLELSQLICEITRNVSDREFQKDIPEAANAAPPLIAEGFARFTDGEMIRYLRMARGELAEVQSQLQVGMRQKHFTKDAYDAACTLARRAMGTTTNLLKSKLRRKRRRRTNK